jgi:hypothetical protein
MNWVLNLIGIMIYFINRFANRKKKTVSFSLKYWLKDNWCEMGTVLLIDLALMIILNSPGTEIDFDALFIKSPIGIKVAGELLMSFLLGLGLSSLFYSIFKRKVRDAR